MITVQNRNMFETEFLSIFKLLFFLQTLFGFRKFRIVNNNLSPNRILEICVCLVFNLAILGLCCMTIIEFTVRLNIQVAVKAIYGIIYAHFAVFFMILTILNIIERDDNVTLLIQLQEIDRSLYNADDYRHFKMVTLVSCCFYIVAYTALLVSKVIVDPNWGIVRILAVGATIVCDLEVMYVAIIIAFLTRKASKWIEIVQNSESQMNLQMTHVMLNLFKKIIETLHLTRKLFQLTILVHLITTFTESLLYVEILILYCSRNAVYKSSLDIISHTSGVAIWITKALVVEIIVSWCYETLYKRIEELNCVAIYKLCSKNSGCIRKLSKNVPRLSKSAFCKLTACGAVVVDAALPLRLVGLVATYTFVLMQFHFLE